MNQIILKVCKLHGEKKLDYQLFERGKYNKYLCLILTIFFSSRGNGHLFKHMQFTLNVHFLFWKKDYFPGNVKCEGVTR